MKHRVMPCVCLLLMCVGNPAAQSDGANPAAKGGATHVASSPQDGGVLAAFTDRDLWAAAAGGTITLIDFESFSDGTQIIDQLTPYGISGVSGSSPSVPSGVAEQFVTASSSLVFPMFVAGTLPTEPNFFSNVLVDHVPVWNIPSDPILVGSHIFGQVYMNNAPLFPTDPYKLSNGLDVVIGVGSSSYGPATGMQLWLAQAPLLGGSLKFAFSIDGP